MASIDGNERGSPLVVPWERDGKRRGERKRKRERERERERERLEGKRINGATRDERTIIGGDSGGRDHLILMRGRGRTEGTRMRDGIAGAKIEIFI